MTHFMKDWFSLRRESKDQGSKRAEIDTKIHAHPTSRCDFVLRCIKKCRKITKIHSRDAKSSPNIDFLIDFGIPTSYGLGIRLSKIAFAREWVSWAIVEWPKNDVYQWHNKQEGVLHKGKNKGETWYDQLKELYSRKIEIRYVSFGANELLYRKHSI